MAIANTSRPTAGISDESANALTQRAIADYPGLVQEALHMSQNVIPTATRRYEAQLRRRMAVRVRQWGTKYTLKEDWAGGSYTGNKQTPYTRSRLITWGEVFDELETSIPLQDLYEAALELTTRNAVEIGRVAAEAADKSVYDEMLEEDLSSVYQTFEASGRSTSNQIIINDNAASGSGTDYWDVNCLLYTSPSPRD